MPPDCWAEAIGLPLDSIPDTPNSAGCFAIVSDPDGQRIAVLRWRFYYPGCHGLAEWRRTGVASTGSRERGGMVSGEYEACLPTDAGHRDFAAIARLLSALRPRLPAVGKYESKAAFVYAFGAALRVKTEKGERPTQAETAEALELDDAATLRAYLRQYAAQWPFPQGRRRKTGERTRAV